MKKIEVLKLPAYCYPEQISSSHLIEDLNKAFYQAGFHTTAYAPTPCRGIDDETRKKYKKIKHERLENGSLDLYRFSLFKEGKNPIGRALRYVLSNLIQYYKGISAKNIDIIFALSTPPTQGILCGKVAKKLSKRYGYKVPFVYSLQDVFPDSLVSAGMTSKGSLIWRIGRKIEDITYRFADKIIVISDDIKKNILAKGVPEEKIAVIPNWIDTEKVYPVPRSENALFDELGIDRNDFIIVYAGNLGMAQGIDTFIDAAKQIDDVKFLIFGEGSSKEEYAKRCEGYKHIHMLPLMPRERVSEVYSMGDLSLVACKQGSGSGAVPSKTFSIMSTATPVLLNFDAGTELWNLIEANKCGLCTNAGKTQELVEAIRYAKQHSEELNVMGENARKCVEQNYSKETGTGRIINLMEETLKKAGNKR